MDEYQNLDLQTFSYFMKFQFLKKMTHLALPLSLLSLLFPHSLPWLSFLHCFRYCFSTFPLQLITHTIDKNCIFILCNGILVFVVKRSGLVSSNYKSNDNYEDNSYINLKPVTLDIREPLSSRKATMEVNGDEKEIGVVDIEEMRKEAIYGEDGGVEETEEEEKKLEGECSAENVTEREEKNEHEEEVVIEVDDEDDHDDDGDYDDGDESAKLSAEELNKKFDEFIRKMKEELRTEARQQLIMVQEV